MTENPVPRRVYKLAVFSLAIASFALGVAEFATMGLLPNIAEGFGISVPEVGHAVSYYALGVVIGAPLITTLTAHMDRKVLLLVLVGLIVAGNVATVFAPNPTAFNVARFIAGLPHGAYFGVAAVVAASLAPVERRGRAMSRVALGLTVANIVGVPIAAALGSMMGWRTAYGLVAGIGLLALFMIALTVPRVRITEAAPSARREMKALLRPQIILTLLAGSIGFGGMFAVYTYITPTMTQVAGVPETMIPWILGIYGVGMTVGSLIAGPLADKSIERTGVFGMLFSAFALTMFGLFTDQPFVAITAFFFIGVAGSLITTAMQMRLFRDSTDAPSLSAAMNHSAFNTANAIGAWLGGVVIAAGYGYRAPAWVGLVLCFAGLLVLLLAIALRRGGTERAVSREVVEV